MKINSLTFGEIEVDEKTIYTFEEGIPGLRGITRYSVIESDELMPFRWLQACDAPFLSMMMLDPLLIEPTYEMPLTREHVPLLGAFEPEDISIMVLVVVPKNPKQMTANLLAPLVFNSKTLKGAQVVIDGTREMLRVKVIKDE